MYGLVGDCRSGWGMGRGNMCPAKKRADRGTLSTMEAPELALLAAAASWVRVFAGSLEMSTYGRCAGCGSG